MRRQNDFRKKRVVYMKVKSVNQELWSDDIINWDHVTEVWLDALKGLSEQAKSMDIAA